MTNQLAYKYWSTGKLRRKQRAVLRKYHRLRAGSWYMLAADAFRVAVEIEEELDRRQETHDSSSNGH